MYPSEPNLACRALLLFSKIYRKNYYDALPYSARGAYVNFVMDEGQERVQASFRDNYGRLAVIKKKYDPTNFFRVNQNITPAS